MKKIITDPKILHGKACIENTRIPVHMVLELLAAGETNENIMLAYPQLTIEDIQSCIQYAATLVSEEIVFEPKAA